MPRGQISFEISLATKVALNSCERTLDCLISAETCVAKLVSCCQHSTPATSFACCFEKAFSETDELASTPKGEGYR